LQGTYSIEPFLLSNTAKILLWTLNSERSLKIGKQMKIMARV